MLRIVYPKFPENFLTIILSGESAQKEQERTIEGRNRKLLNQKIRCHVTTNVLILKVK